MKSNDSILLNQLKKGNSNAFAQLFDLYFEKLVRVAEYHLQDTETAKDIVMDVFTSFIEQPQRFNEVKSVYTYLGKIVQNKSLNRLRNLGVVDNHKDRVMEAMLLAEQDDEPNELFSQKVKQVHALIDKLSPKSKLVFTRCVIYGEKYKDVAEELDVSINTVGTLIKRAYKAIRTELGVNITIIIHLLMNLYFF
ncbi:RNA polymerase sigma-70 factor [Carboxylicivirga sp. RSCT41]|uniref:RNA polymerase sigma-70 factor n=1 Tax=Carboxylicivirga agarovorans TaxID=3417570 RepID=UPI003D32CA2D